MLKKKKYNIYYDKVLEQYHNYYLNMLEYNLVVGYKSKVKKILENEVTVTKIK
jgi:hypothetical protein